MSSELVALTVEDLEQTKRGLLVTLRRSKTDQEGQGHQRAIPFGRRPETAQWPLWPKHEEL